MQLNESQLTIKPSFYQPSFLSVGMQCLCKYYVKATSLNLIESEKGQIEQNLR